MNKTYISKNPAYLMPKNFKEQKNKRKLNLKQKKTGTKWVTNQDLQSGHQIASESQDHM